MGRKLAKKEKTTASSGHNKTNVEILQEKGIKMVTDLNGCNAQWLIEGFLKKPSLTMIYAGAGSGKSYFALYLAKFLLEKDKIQSVYYFDGDNSSASFKERGGESFIQNPKFRYFTGLSNKKFTLFDTLLELIDLSNSLIIIDSIRNFIKEDFNKDFKVIASLNKLQDLRDKGATVIFLHHQPKQRDGENNKAYKGATSFIDSVDEGYFLYKKDSEDYKELKQSEFIVLVEPQKKRFNTKPQAFKLNTARLSLESAEYLKYAETEKAKNTLDLVKRILNEHKELCQQDLVKEIIRRKEEEYITIVGRNALWRLLDKYKGVKWDIWYESSSIRGGQKKLFKNIETKEESNA